LADAYTDQFGYPLSAAETLRRLRSPRSTGFYHNGVWVKRPPKKMAQPEQQPEPQPQPEKKD
jgi:hypothetical protein